MPIPRITVIVNALEGSSFFSVVDFIIGYWQIEMEEIDKCKTAFFTFDGHWEFERLPIGLCNAPATFQRFMNEILAGLTYKICLVYLDEIVISKTYEEHINNLKLSLTD